MSGFPVKDAGVQAVVEAIARIVRNKPIREALEDGIREAGGKPKVVLEDGTLYVWPTSPETEAFLATHGDTNDIDWLFAKVVDQTEFRFPAPIIMRKLYSPLRAADGQDFGRPIDRLGSSDEE